jgi:hypothetical protein
MQMRIRIKCGLDSRSRAGFWPNDRAGVRAVRTIQGGKNEVRIRFENIFCQLVTMWNQSQHGSSSFALTFSDIKLSSFKHCC